MRNIFAGIFWFFRGIKVFALVGKSGTGKSFRARLIMEKYGIELLIDDGLLIQNQRIVAGKSAKKENAYLAAVRTALFTEKIHRREVRHAIEKSRFKKILVIATSERMVRKICATLQLPEPTKFITIEDIATSEEIETAINTRQFQGRHIIPVPSVEVKRNYPRIMADSIKVILKQGFGVLKRKKSWEKTMVRPEFSRKGSVTISESALTQMIMHCVDEFVPGIMIRRMSFSVNPRGYHINLHVQVPYRLELTGSIYSLQQYIIEHVERFTGIIIDELNIIIDNVIGSNYNKSREKKNRKSGGRG